MIGGIFALMTLFGFAIYVLEIKKEITDLLDTIYSLEIENKSLEIENKLLKRYIERVKKDV